MNSSKALALAVPAHVLPAEGTTKLLRVFCFLRQHERKAKIAKKVAALHAWRPPHAQQQPTDEEQQRSPTETLDKGNLIDELNLLVSCEGPDAPAVSGTRISKSVAGEVGAGAAPSKHNTTPSVTLEELRGEVRELQKGVIAGTSDPSGVITASDLGSCMKSMNRISLKTEIQWMIWEVDDDLDGCINWEEFKGCYMRTLMDKHDLEPNQLFYLIQFLLCDTDGSQSVSADELTAELQRIGGTEHLTAKLCSVIQGESEEQQLLRKLTLSEFLEATLADLPATFNLH